VPASPSHLASDGDPLDEGELRNAGFRTIEQLSETASTMLRAREIAADPAVPLPAVVVADRQLRGRGRSDASWWQPPGSLAASIIIGGEEPAAAAVTPATAVTTAPAPIWSLVCGVAVAETLRQLEPDLRTTVRWPNDVEVGRRKLAGILVEVPVSGRAIFGIGVNTSGAAADAPPPVRQRLVTVPDLTGRQLPRGPLLSALLPRLLGLLDESGRDPDALVGRYRPLCSLEGRLLTVYQASAEGGELHGLCRGIAADGSLVLDTPSGRVHVTRGSLTAPADVWRAGDAG
jgi:BirA family biotin operon repressor/biotin-[acetyl-CoA-carboxylase] ligase